MSVLNALSPGSEPECRVMPHNLEAEQGLLGMLLIDNRHIESVDDFLLPQHFCWPVHGRLFEAIQRVSSEGRNASPVTLKEYFEKDEGLKDVGGPKYLAELASEIPLINSADDYGRQIYELYQRREMISVGQDLVARAYDFKLDVEPSELLVKTEEELFQLAEQGEREGGLVGVSELIDDYQTFVNDALLRDGELVGLPTGIGCLDHLVRGFEKKDSIIIAGQSSMGKTSLATSMIGPMASYCHKNELGPVAVFSLEMSSRQILARVLAPYAGVSARDAETGEISEEQCAEILRVSNSARGKLNLFIDDTPGLSIAGIRSRARRLKRQIGLSAVFIDYLQVIGSQDLPSRPNTEVERVSMISNQLKPLAKVLDVPVITLCQLNREVAKREDRRPQVTDLKQSSSIEQDADVVIAIHRDHFYAKKERPLRKPGQSDTEYAGVIADWEQHVREIEQDAEIRVLKQRRGRVDDLKVGFDESLNWFYDLDQPDTQKRRAA